MDFTGAYCPKALARFLIPLMAAELFQQIYGLINTAVVSRALDDTALAVMGACGGLLAIRGRVLAGMFYGFGICLGMAVGSGDPRRLPAAFSAALRYTLLLSGLGLLAALGVNGLMALGNVPPQLRPSAAPYLILSFAGAGVTAAKLLLMVLLQAVGDTGYFSALAVLGALTNTVLVVLFIGVWKGGVAWAALATVLTNALLALFLLRYIRRNRPRLIAAQAIALSLQAVLIAPQGELGTASGVITGQNVGAGNQENILAYHRRLLRLFVLLGLAAAGLVWLVGRPLVGLVAGPGQPAEVMEASLLWLRLTVLVFPVSFAILYRNALQAMGRYGGVVALGGMEVVCSAAAAWLLIPAFGYMGGALGVVLSWGASALLGSTLFRHTLRGGDGNAR